ncbi:MAG: hypothetical protein QM496_12710 [Verrucomicrobiota bacterium]
MMKKKISVLMVLILAGLLNPLYAEEIVIKVVDETREVLVGADVVIEFVGFTQVKSKAHYGKTNKKGEYGVSGKIQFNGVYVRVGKDGYYDSIKEGGFLPNKDHKATLVLRRIERPVPLYVRDVFLEFPIFDEWLGFDFEVGDWVAPQGKGKSRDILFKFHREYMGSKYSAKKLKEVTEISKRFAERRKEEWNPDIFELQTAKWRSELIIKFPSEFDGMVEEKSGYLPYSKMKMPHLAPKEGYREDEVVIKKKTYRTEKDERENLEEMRSYVKNGVPEIKPTGYFIRTRVTEVDGKIIKANYAKLPKMIGVGAAGSINFIYYFNPVVNDRNLEYQPKSNLATEQRRFYDP